MAKKKNKKKKHTTPEKIKPKTTPEKNYRKDPEKIELMHARIGMGTHTILAILIGWLSIQLSAMFGNMITVVIGLVVVIAFGYALERLLGKKGIKWWLSNGIIIYLFIWLIAWSVFYNMAMNVVA